MKQSLFFSIFFLIAFSCLGQTQISGTVVDTQGSAVPFVTVIFQNSSEGTITDEEGKFSLKSPKNHTAVEFSFVGFKTTVVKLSEVNNMNMKVVMEEEAASLSEVRIFTGKTSKENNPAIDILRKIWAHKRQNGVRKFDQYSYRKYEKLEFDINTIDSSFIDRKIFKGMEVMFEYLDTNRITGKTYLPIFLNESVSMVYGDNEMGKKREVLLGNQNSGFNSNQTLIATVKDIYEEINVYDNYLRFFDKNFISPLSTTGIHNYNYVLADSSYIGDKWCYNIFYYPRRKNELTFKGDFWVNDTTWAIKKINLEMDAKANVNWVKGVYIEQEFEVLNDSIFLMTRDFFMADFAFQKKEEAGGIYGKRSVLYDSYKFNEEKPGSFYNEVETTYNDSLYHRSDEFWKENRLESLNQNEEGVYKMLDTLQNVKSFKRIFDVSSALFTGYWEFNGWDYGPIYSGFGYNEVEGARIRAGGRTYFGQHDPWRIEGYGAYGFRDEKFKYGISGKVLLDHKSRLVLTAGKRYDIEQLGASLTNTTDVLGRSLASSSIVNVGDNDKLSWIDLTDVAMEVEPVKNLRVRLGTSHRNLRAASPTFSLAYYTDETLTETSSEISQTEVSTMFTYTPGRLTSGFGVERYIVNEGDYPTFFANYSHGFRGGFFNSDFQYEKIQLFYNQPLMIGGFGRAFVNFETGKIFGTVPLALLSVVPGNQTYFKLPNSFSLLNFYEFVTDTYVAAHFEHNFNGRLFARVPLLRDLNLREIVGVRGVWGEISEANRSIDASGISLIAPHKEPYYEYSVGVGNIFKFIRIDAHFRGNYFENEDARSFGVTAAFGFHF